MEKVWPLVLVATTLANGRRDGKAMIPTDETVGSIIQRHAASLNAFVQSKIDAFARGESGRPIVPEALRQMMGTNR